MPTAVRFIIYTRVVSIEERFVHKWMGGVGDEAVFRDASIGWFIHLEGSYEAIFVGDVKPAFELGEDIKITIERTPDALPSPTPI